MKKETADVLKREFNSTPGTEDVLEYMSEETAEESSEILEFLEKHLEQEITDYCLDESFDLIDTDESDLIRTLWFSRGMEDTYILLTTDGGIKTMDPEIPMGLLAQVATALEKLREE